MFCPKCGKELPDGALFCAGCGTKLAPKTDAASTDLPETPQQPETAQTPPQYQPPQQQTPPPYQAPQQPQYQPPQYQPQPKQPAQMPPFLKAKPSFWSFLCSFAAFVFMILPVFASKETGRFSIFHGGIFDVSALAGVSFIFGIIAVIIFVCRFVSSGIDTSKLLPAKFNVEAILQLAFLALNAFVLLFAFIAAVSTNGTQYYGVTYGNLHLWIWWYVSLAATAGAAVLTILPGKNSK